MTTDVCCACARPVSAHRADDGSWIGCVHLSPLNVTLADGTVITVRTPRDVYRLCARARKAA